MPEETNCTQCPPFPISTTGVGTTAAVTTAALTTGTTGTTGTTATTGIPAPVTTGIVATTGTGGLGACCAFCEEFDPPFNIGATICTDQSGVAPCPFFSPVCNGVTEGLKFKYSLNVLCPDGSTCPAPICGDGHVDAPGEQCDDGNYINGDGCNSICQNETCGNGIVDFGEECDDGNGFNGDGCTTLCLLENRCCVDDLHPLPACESRLASLCTVPDLPILTGNATCDFSPCCSAWGGIPKSSLTDPVCCTLRGGTVTAPFTTSGLCCLSGTTYDGVDNACCTSLGGTTAPCSGDGGACCSRSIFDFSATPVTCAFIGPASGNPCNSPNVWHGGGTSCGFLGCCVPPSPFTTKPNTAEKCCVGQGGTWGTDPTCTILPVVPTGGDPLSTLGACAVDVNQDGHFGDPVDSCTGNITASQCSVMKNDPKYLVWSTTTCSTLVGAISNTSGTCCMFQGFGHMGCESVAKDNCTGLYEPFLATGAAACPDCTHDGVCNSTRPSGCDSAICDIDTRICRCARTTDDDSSTTVFVNTDWLVPVLAAVLFACIFIALCYMWSAGIGFPRQQTGNTRVIWDVRSGAHYQAFTESLQNGKRPVHYRYE